MLELIGLAIILAILLCIFGIKFLEAVFKFFVSAIGFLFKIPLLIVLFIVLAFFFFL